MRAFRLVRRSLLCLVVGVTAFGVAGWAFRPRATWTTELPPSEYFRFGDDLRDADDHQDVWLSVLPVGDDVDEGERLLMAFNADTGERLCSIPLQVGDDSPDWIPLADGRLAMITIGPGRQSDYLTCRIFDSKNADSTRLVRLEGEWQIAEDGLHVSRSRPKGDGVEMEIRNLEDGGVLNRISFDHCPENIDDGIAAYHAKTNRVAVSQSLRARNMPPYGIEVLEASTGKLVDTFPVTLPENLDPGPDNYAFTVDGRELRFSLPGEPLDRVKGPFITYGLDLQTRAFRRYASMAFYSNPTKEKIDYEFDHDGLRRTVRTRIRLDPPKADVFLYDDEIIQNPDWRPIPFPVIVMTDRPQAWGRLLGARPYLVPGSRQVIVKSIEEPVGAFVPEDLRKHLPATWTKRPQTRLRWHDWDANVWRDVGCHHEITNVSVRPKSLLTISRTQDGALFLQSWPLPPRDPKWPALGVATFFTAATWWLCAKRYARKLRRAA